MIQSMNTMMNTNTNKPDPLAFYHEVRETAEMTGASAAPIREGEHPSPFRHVLIFGETVAVRRVLAVLGFSIEGRKVSDLDGRVWGDLVADRETGRASVSLDFALGRERPRLS